MGYRYRQARAVQRRRDKLVYTQRRYHRTIRPHGTQSALSVERQIRNKPHQFFRRHRRHRKRFRYADSGNAVTLYQEPTQKTEKQKLAGKIHYLCHQGHRTRREFDYHRLPAKEFQRTRRLPCRDRRSVPRRRGGARTSLVSDYRLPRPTAGGNRRRVRPICALPSLPTSRVSNTPPC